MTSLHTDHYTTEDVQALSACRSEIVESGGVISHYTGSLKKIVRLHLLRQVEQANPPKLTVSRRGVHQSAAEPRQKHIIYNKIDRKVQYKCRGKLNGHPSLYPTSTHDELLRLTMSAHALGPFPGQVGPPDMERPDRVGGRAMMGCQRSKYSAEGIVVQESLAVWRTEHGIIDCEVAREQRKKRTTSRRACYNCRVSLPSPRRYWQLPQ